MRAIAEDALFATTIKAEAGNQPLAGQVGVAEVVLERVKRGYNTSEKTITGVIMEPSQFSCWNTETPWRARMVSEDWDSPGMQMARKAIEIAREGRRTVKGAVLYHTVQKPRGAKKWPPYWASMPGVTLVATIGDHVFYTDGE